MAAASVRRRIVTFLRGSASMLSLQLFAWLFAVITVAFAVYATLDIHATAEQWNRMVFQGAQRFSELIQHSTHYSMLLNRKEDVHQIIRTIVNAADVEGVRVYDKTGAIIFSAVDAEIGTQVDLRAEACVSCHTSPEPLATVPEGRRFRVFSRPDGERVLGLINPIENAPECSQAACHAHPAEQRILGVLDVQMSMAEPEARLAEAKRQAVWAAMLTALGAGLFSALFIVRVVRQPVATLIAGVREVAEGNLDTEIRVSRDDEIGQLAEAFNGMTRDLRRARAELTEWSNRLEDRLEEKTVELGQTQRQVVHMEKMASLGKLAATVAHELNNPLAGILTYAKLVDRTLRESEAEVPEQEELERYLSLIAKEAGRCGSIVRNLLSFARRSGGDFALQSLNQIIERSLMLVRHHLEMSSVSLDSELLAGDDGVVCDADQIQQALLALLVNAVEAMPDGGRLRLAARDLGETVELLVEDTGGGIPAEAQSHIFEPFFSSKEQIEGAGLGLAVVYGIVQRHRGSIEVESVCHPDPHHGTRFRLVLPRRQSPEEDGDELAWAKGWTASDGGGHDGSVGKGRMT